MFTKKDYIEQKDKIYEERYQAVEGIKGRNQEKLLERIRTVFFLLGAKASRMMRGRRRGKDMVGLFQKVTGEEIIRHCEKALKKIESIAENKSITLPLPAQRRMAYRKDFFEFILYHTSRDITYWLTMEEVSAIEMLQTQEQAAFGDEV